MVSGAAAPGFTITDTAGKAVQLADYKGKYVVLEWTNPECPFVRKHYSSGNMQGLQKEWGSRNVVWLSINSTNASSSEFKTPREMSDWMKAQGAAPAATLLDSTSGTGRAYGAKTTPHMFVVDPGGKVVYAGAIDDKRSANPADAKTANNYVRAALTEAMAGKPVTVAQHHALRLQRQVLTLLRPAAAAIAAVAGRRRLRTGTGAAAAGLRRRRIRARRGAVRGHAAAALGQARRRGGGRRAAVRARAGERVGGAPRSRGAPARGRGARSPTCRPASGRRRSRPPPSSCSRRARCAICRRRT